MFREKSKTQLNEDLKEIIHDLFVSCLDRAEKILKPNLNSQQWNQFRFEILNMGNSAIRDLKPILNDYQIEFRPSIFKIEYRVGEHVVNSLSDLPGVYFRWDAKEQPELLINTGQGETSLTLATELVNGLKCGKVYEKDGYYIYMVVGLWDIYNKVIPFFDEKKPFRGNSLPKYIEWKEKVIEKLC